MPEKKKLAAPFNAWIALSDSGHPVSFIGYAFTRKELRVAYTERFGHDLEVAGYRLVKVRVTTPPSPGDDA